MIFSWQNCATNVVLQLMKGLNPLWCDCSDSNTAELKSSICYTCLPPSALTDTPPGFPLLPNLHLSAGCSLRLGAVGEGARLLLMKPLLAAPSERKKKKNAYMRPWWSVFCPTPPPTLVYFPPCHFCFLYLPIPSSPSLPSFISSLQQLHTFARPFIILPFSLSPSMMEQADGRIRIPNGHPLSFYCLAVTITHGW